MQRRRVPGWVSTAASVVGLGSLMGLTWAGMLITIHVDDPDVSGHLVGGLFYGIGWTAFWLVLARSARRRYRLRWPNLTDEQHAAAAAAVSSGPIPDQLPVLQEAIRRARRFPGTTAERPWVMTIVFGALTAGVAICAVLINPWLWPTAALGALGVARLIWVIVRVRPRLAALEAAAESMRRSAAAEPEHADHAEATAAICLIAPRPRFSTSPSTELLVGVDGRPQRASWGETTLAVRAGRHELTASVDAPFGGAGRARADVEVTAGAPVRIYYTVPWMLRMRGQLGPTPVRRRGLWALIAVMAAPLVLVAIVGFLTVA